MKLQLAWAGYALAEALLWMKLSTPFEVFLSIGVVNTSQLHVCIS